MRTTAPTIGIIGGFGPDTSAAFCMRLVEHAHALKPGHPPAFAMDFVSVPPALAGEAIGGSREAGAILAQAIHASIVRLQGMGVQTVALPCNTMHLFAESFGIPPQLKLLHIVDAVVHELQREHITHVGLLATQLTVGSGLYAHRLAAAGIACTSPSDALQAALSRAIGHFVATGTVTADTTRLLQEAFSAFERQGACATVLGCTDIGGMIERCALQPSIACIDSMDVLAKACAERCV